MYPSFDSGHGKTSKPKGGREYPSPSIKGKGKDTMRTSTLKKDGIENGKWEGRREVSDLLKEDKLLREYQRIIDTDNEFEPLESAMDKEDVLQTRILYLLENKEKMDVYRKEDPKRWTNSLNFYVRKRRINTFQSREKFISLSDNDTSENTLVSIDHDADLQNWILSQKDAEGKEIFTPRQKEILSLRFTGEKQTDIAKLLDTDQGNLARTFKTIDSKLAKLPIKEMVSSTWYQGKGNDLPMSRVWAAKCQDTNRPHIPCPSLPIIPSIPSLPGIVWNMGSLRSGCYTSHVKAPVLDIMGRIGKSNSFDATKNLKDIQDRRDAEHFHFYQNVIDCSRGNVDHSFNPFSEESQRRKWKK
jgi:hypothetical protein